MAERLRIAVLGMAHDHLWTNLRDLARLETAELVGGADPNPVLRQRFIERTACERVYPRYEALLDELEPDAALVYCATAMHADLVELCAARRVHALVEKPMAASLEQASRMRSAGLAAGIVLMVNWPTAWSPSLRTAYRLARAGRLGQLWQITWRGGHCGPDELGCSPEFCGFLFDAQLNGAGALNDYAGYGAGLCILFMQGLPHSVCGMVGRLVKNRIPVDDNGILLLRYPQALCRLEMTWTEAVPHQPPHDLVVYGTAGTLVAGRELILYERGSAQGAAVPLDVLPPGQSCALEHFVECIRTGGSPQFQTSPDVSYDAQQVMEAGLRAALSGTEVRLPLEDHLFRS